MKDSKKSIKLFFLVLTCTFLSDFAYGNDKDSLHLLLNKTDDDKIKVDLYTQLVHQYMYTDFEAAREYADSAYHLAQKIDYAYGEAWSVYYGARNLASNNYFQEALDELPKAISMLEQIPEKGKEIAKCYTLQGWTNKKLSKYHAALTDYDKAYEIYDNLNDDKGRATLLLNIGTIHNGLDDMKTAKKYYEEAKTVNKKIDNKEGLVYVYNSLGYIHELGEEYEEALIDYSKALKLAEELSLTPIQSTILHNMGLTNMKSERLDKALECMGATRKIDVDRADELGLAYVDMTIARIHFLQSKKATNISALKKAYEAGLKFDDTQLQKKSTQYLTEIYTELGMYKETLEQYKLSSILKDSIANKDIQLKVKSLESKRQFELAQKKEEMAQQELIFKNSLAYESKIKRILLSGLGILLLLAFVLYKAYRTTLSVKKQLLVKNLTLKQAEEVLGQKNKDLKKYIELNVELEQFAAIASHDLKAPLKTIRGFMRILKQRFYKGAEENYKSYFDMVERSAKSLNLLVDDLLQFSKANSQALNIERMSLEGIINEVKENLDFSISQSQGQINLEHCNIPLYADRVKIKQVLQNLISNALKFKDAERKPIVEVSSWEDASHIFVSVKDNGIGISAEHFDKVFEKFTRIKTEQDFEGTGLGLSICAKYIKKHKGDIWIERNEDHGVTFTFTISKSLCEAQEVSRPTMGVRKACA